MKDLLPLTLSHAGDTVVVGQLTAVDPAELRKITSFGVFPGVRMRILQTVPVFVLRIAFTELALDREIARKIWVETI